MAEITWNKNGTVKSWEQKQYEPCWVVVALFPFAALIHFVFTLRIFCHRSAHTFHLLLIKQFFFVRFALTLSNDLSFSKQKKKKNIENISHVYTYLPPFVELFQQNLENENRHRKCELFGKCNRVSNHICKVSIDFRYHS